MKNSEREKNRQSLIMYPAWFLILGVLFAFGINYLESITSERISVTLGIISIIMFFIIYVAMLKSHRKELDRYAEFINNANNQLEKDKKELCKIEKEASDAIKTIIKGDKNDL